LIQFRPDARSSAESLRTWEGADVSRSRIQDKIAARKKRGIWMGRMVPLGYRVQDRALHVVDEHAAGVRDLFRRYLEIGLRLQPVLDAENVRLPVRIEGTGKTTGAGSSVVGISTSSSQARSTSDGLHRRQRSS
jgi:hypothetical protein